MPPRPGLLPLLPLLLVVLVAVVLARVLVPYSLPLLLSPPLLHRQLLPLLLLLLPPLPLLLAQPLPLLPTPLKRLLLRLGLRGSTPWLWT